MSVLDNVKLSKQCEDVIAQIAELTQTSDGMIHVPLDILVKVAKLSKNDGVLESMQETLDRLKESYLKMQITLDGR